MDEQQAEHLSRVRHLREAFAGGNEHLVARLREAADDAAEAPHGDGWSAAQTAWHVASVTTRFAALIAGDVPAAQPLDDTFVERPWSTIAAAIPDKLEAVTAATPPGRVTRHDAIAALEASAVKIASAFDTLTPERGGRTGITNKIVGTINLYQVGEWAAAHVQRHHRQIERALAASRNAER